MNTADPLHLAARTYLRTIDGVTDTDARLAALEAAVANLTARLDARDARAADAPATADDDTDSRGLDLWLLDALDARLPEGAISYGGVATVDEGPIRWQWTVPSGPLLADDWSQSTDRIAALSHPVRLRLLQRVLAGTTKTADLGDDPDLGTTGQLHHHLRILVSAGWLQTRRRGHYHVPRERVVPLLVVLAAATS